jgi:hypothetical protein
MKSNRESASKYSEIKRYADGGITYSEFTEPNTFYNYGNAAFAKKDKANLFFENIEKQLKLVKNYMDEINQAKIQFENGQWGYKDSTYVPNVKNYNSIINEYGTFVTKFRSQVNSSIAKINLICNLTILK